MRAASYLFYCSLCVGSIQYILAFIRLYRSSRPQRDDQTEHNRGIKWVCERTVFLVGRTPHDRQAGAGPLSFSLYGIERSACGTPPMRTKWRRTSQNSFIAVVTIAMCPLPWKTYILRTG